RRPTAVAGPRSVGRFRLAESNGSSPSFAGRRGWRGPLYGWLPFGGVQRKFPVVGGPRAASSSIALRVSFVWLSPTEVPRCERGGPEPRRSQGTSTTVPALCPSSTYRCAAAA